MTACLTDAYKGTGGGRHDPIRGRELQHRLASDFFDRHSARRGGEPGTAEYNPDCLCLSGNDDGADLDRYRDRRLSARGAGRKDHLHRCQSRRGRAGRGRGGHHRDLRAVGDTAGLERCKHRFHRGAAQQNDLLLSRAAGHSKSRPTARKGRRHKSAGNTGGLRQSSRADKNGLEAYRRATPASGKFRSHVAGAADASGGGRDARSALQLSGGRVEVFAACRYLRSALPEHRRCGSERPNPTHGRYLAPLAEGPAAGKSTLVRRPEARHVVLRKYTQQSDPEVLQKTYDFETNPPGFTKDLKVSDAGLQGILDFLAATVRPDAAKVPPKNFYDTTILERLEK